MPDGVVTVPSRFTVEETVANLQRILIAKGIKVFAIIDHSGEAAAAGLAMPPTKLVVFGNPRGGTPLMVAAPSIAIDLPMKLLIWQDAKGNVLISYNAPSYLAARHGLAPELSPVLSLVESLASVAGHEST